MSPFPLLILIDRRVPLASFLCSGILYHIHLPFIIETKYILRSLFLISKSTLAFYSFPPPLSLSLNITHPTSLPSAILVDFPPRRLILLPRKKRKRRRPCSLFDANGLEHPPPTTRIVICDDLLAPYKESQRS